MKYRKKPIVIEAHQWFRNGDHPKDNSETYSCDQGHYGGITEGKIVRYYRHPKVPGTQKCNKCSFTMHEHGWIDTLEGGYTVCPGDYIIQGIKGEFYPCKEDIFKLSYERVK